MGNKASKADMLENVRVLLRDVFRLRAEGGPYARLARAHGYVDGYMRVLLELGVADNKELLAIVAEERSRRDGPSTRVEQRHAPEEAREEDIVAVA